jgi:hypothetical protein
MCAAACPAGDDLITFGDLVLDGEAGVGVGATLHADVLHYALRTAHLTRDGGIVQDVVGSEEFVHQLQVASAEDLLEEPADDGFVLFGWHCVSSFRIAVFTLRPQLDSDSVLTY